MFHDALEPAPDTVLATEDQITTLIDFAHAWGGNRPLVVNCYAGLSRSPAVLIIMLATLYPGRERQIVEMVSGGAPHAAPNRHVVDLGDRLLGCDGRLIEAVTALPPAARGFTWTGLFEVNTLT